MAPLTRLFRLPSQDRRLVVRAAVLLAAVSAGLRLVRLPQLRRWLARTSAPPDAGSSPLPERIAWAVSAAARHLPGRPGCLAQALTAQTLLASQGITSEIRFGVAAVGERGLDAHAWLEQEGRILIGGADAPTRFRPLVATREGPE